MADVETIIPGVTGLILAGGRSTRMGGRDKALLPFDGRPMIEWVIDRFQPQVDALLLNSNRDDAALAPFGYPVIADSISGYAGPLAGLHAGLSWAKTSLLACVPCDAPLLPQDLVIRLAAALTEAKPATDIAVACTANGLQPTFLLCRCTLKQSIEAFLGTGGRAFHQWLAQQRRTEVYFADGKSFSNINTPQDMASILT